MNKKSVKGRSSLSFNIGDESLDIDHIIATKLQDRSKEFESGELGYAQKLLNQFKDTVVNQKNVTNRKATDKRATKKKNASNNGNVKEKDGKEKAIRQNRKNDTTATKLTLSSNNGSIDKENCVMETNSEGTNSNLKTQIGNNDKTKVRRGRANNVNVTKNTVKNATKRNNQKKVISMKAVSNSSLENPDKLQLQEPSFIELLQKPEEKFVANDSSKPTAKKTTKPTAQRNTKARMITKKSPKVEDMRATNHSKISRARENPKIVIKKKEMTTKLEKSNNANPDIKRESMNNISSIPTLTEKDIKNEPISTYITTDQLDSPIGLDAKKESLHFDQMQTSDQVSKEKVDLKKKKKEKAKSKKKNTDNTKKKKKEVAHQYEVYNHRPFHLRRLERQERERKRRIRRREERIGECMEKFSYHVVKLVKDMGYLKEEEASNSNSTEDNISYTDSSDFSDEESCSCSCSETCSCSEGCSCSEDCSCTSCSDCNPYDSDEYSEYTSCSSSDY